MARIVVIGGGLIGFATALMVAKQGHDVTILERDPAAPPGTPDEAWDHWERQGVMQFRQPHYLLPQGLRVLEEHLPEMACAIRGAGAIPHTMLSALPPGITDRAARPDDGKFLTSTRGGRCSSRRWRARPAGSWRSAAARGSPAC
jgi:2-polyprenyl-6-methoxyphenol hydroxylase-like FAD-dependent oxidoreductase